MTFFLTFKRGNELVFAREVEAPNFFAAIQRARTAMVGAGVATKREFASGAVRPTHVGELPAMQARINR